MKTWNTVGVVIACVASLIVLGEEGKRGGKRKKKENIPSLTRLELARPKPTDT
jgi:hypothetical protein